MLTSKFSSENTLVSFEDTGKWQRFGSKILFLFVVLIFYANNACDGIWSMFKDVQNTQICVVWRKGFSTGKNVQEEGNSICVSDVGIFCVIYNRKCVIRHELELFLCI